MRKTFKAKDDFEAFYAAEEYLKENGYSIGSIERNAPIGVAKGDCYISKWCNLGSDRKFLDGVIAEGDKRNGDVTIIIFDDVDVKGWWNYQSYLIENEICTKYEFFNKLGHYKGVKLYHYANRQDIRDEKVTVNDMKITDEDFILNKGDMIFIGEEGIKVL